MAFGRALLTKLTVLAAVSFVVSLAASAAPDVVTVGSLSSSGTTFDVPIYIRDSAGSPLGTDQPAGSRIQAFSIKVDYSPASAVQAITLNRAGITAALTPISEFKPSGPGSVSLLATFQESTNPIPFALNAALPGDLVARLTITLAAAALPGSTVALSLDPSLTQLTDQGGSPATKETEANGGLALVDGSIQIPPLTVSLIPDDLVVQLGGTGSLTARLSTATGTSTTVTLSTSKPDIVSVPSSVSIAAGQRNAVFNVAGVALGSSVVTAVVGSSMATALVTVNNCETPPAPVASGPAQAAVGANYTISWNAIASAGEYVIDEATSPSFQGPLTRTVTGTSASYSHGTAGIRYYYRVRAHNNSAGCDLYSPHSAAVSVLISTAPSESRGFFPVVGSLPGAVGAYFRTTLSLNNPGAAPISGTLVFHPADTSGSPADPTLPYTLSPFQTTSFGDLLPAMGVATGLGSVDVAADPGSPLPVAVARVFDDNGSAGSTGFATGIVPAGDALSSGDVGVLLVPVDLAKTRFAIGIRSLEAGAAISITVRDASGTIVRSATKSLTPTFFAQYNPAALLGGYELGGGESIAFAVTGGAAFVYGSTTDNVTNDPSIQFARRVE